MQFLKLLLLLITLLLATGCEDVEKLKSELTSLKAKQLVFNATKGSLRSDKEKALKEKKKIEDKNIELLSQIDTLKENLKEKDNEIKRIKLNDPNIYWTTELKPVFDDCYEFAKRANTYIENFSKKGPHYRNQLSPRLKKCNRENHLNNLLEKLKFNKAKRYAKTKSEKRKVSFWKKEHRKYGKILKRVIKGKSTDLYNFLTENVIMSYKLEKIYDTPLKIKNFKKTQDFKKKLANLKSIRKKILKQKYTITINDAFKEPFNTEQGAFLYKVGKSFGFNRKKGKPPYAFRGFHFPELEYHQKPSPFGENRPNIQFLKMVVYKKLAVIVESDPKKYVLLIRFDVTGTKKMAFKFYDNNKNDWGGLHTLEANVVTTNNVELIIKNKKSGKLYHKFDFDSNI